VNGGADGLEVIGGIVEFRLCIWPSFGMGPRAEQCEWRLKSKQVISTSAMLLAVHEPMIF